MALLRDKTTGLPVRNSKGEAIKRTTDGETRVREIRDAKEKARAKLHAANAKARAKRTPEEQIAVLDERLGVGQGAGKERLKLQRLIVEREEALRKAKEEAAEKEAKKKAKTEKVSKVQNKRKR